MGIIGRAISYLKVLKGGITVPTVKGEAYKGENIQAEIFGTSGDDSPPLPDDLVFFSRNSQTGGLVYLGTLDQANAPEALAGERRLYSRDSSGAVASVLWLKDDGTIEVAGSADNAVRYAVLNTALQGLVTAINLALATKQDNAGAAGTLTLDITGSKVAEVKLP